MRFSKSHRCTNPKFVFVVEKFIEVMLNPGSDTDLWNRYLAGDEKAIARLYEEYHDILLIGLYKQTGNMEIAKNVLQDVFLQLLEEGNRNQKVRNFYSWIKIRLYRYWIKIYHKETLRARILSEEICPWREKAVEQGHNLDSNIIYGCIRKIENKLYRHILLLTLEGYDNKSIAHRLNKEPGYIRRRKYEARNQLQQMLHSIGMVE